MVTRHWQGNARIAAQRRRWRRNARVRHWALWVGVILAASLWAPLAYLLGTS